jgi:hypothetical protein
MGSAYNSPILIRKLEVKRQLASPRCRLEDTIKMSLKYLDCWGVDRIKLDQDMVQFRTSVTMVMDVRVPLKSGHFVTSERLSVFKGALFSAELLLLLRRRETISQ